MEVVGFAATGGVVRRTQIGEKRTTCRRSAGVFVGADNYDSRPSRRRRQAAAVSRCCSEGPGSGGSDGSSDAVRPNEIDHSRLFLNGPVPGDRSVRTLSANGEVVVRVISCTGLVSGATEMTRTTPVVSAAFGRALTCALLLASGKKNGETLQLEFRGDGPVRGITAIANGEGEVRGYVGNPAVDLPPSAAGKLDVGQAVGKGILAVVRQSPFAKAPYSGLVKLVSGEIAEDVASYLAESEQTPSALGAGVYVNEYGRVTAAGGYLAQLLPGASEETISILERNVRGLPTPTELARQGLSADEICGKIMEGLEPLAVVAEAPRYACKCSVERVKRTVALLPEGEVAEILATHQRIEALCEFCGQIWYLDREQVAEMYATREQEKQEALEQEALEQEAPEHEDAAEGDKFLQ